MSTPPRGKTTSENGLLNFRPVQGGNVILIYRIFSPWIQVYLKIKIVKTVTRVCLPHTKNSAKRDSSFPFCDDNIPYTRVKQTRNTRIPNHWQGRKLVLAKRAFIIYLEVGGGGVAMMILRGVTLFPYYDLGGGGGGTVENFQRKWHWA